MSHVDSRANLLDGPRGRRFCLSLLMSADPSLWSLTFRARDDTELLSDLAQRVAAFDLPGSWPEPALLDALAVSTGAARYWQEPDELDLLLRHPHLGSALARVAAHVGNQPSTGWWSSPIAVASQRFVQWTDQEPADSAPALTGAPARLEQWKANTLEKERRAAKRPRAVTANWSGEWWSTPALVGLVTTSRSLPGLGAVKLLLVEDGFGWTTARVWSLKPAAGCRVYEISGPRAWTELVARYPMDVSFSRRHDWWRSGGHDGSWLLPDWSAVASDFDAVHLTVTATSPPRGEPSRSATRTPCWPAGTPTKRIGSATHSTSRENPCSGNGTPPSRAREAGARWVEAQFRSASSGGGILVVY